MLPIVSTRPLSNFELTLSPDGTRVGNHRCSNLLDYTEVKTRYSFLTEATKNPEVIGETAPYQYSTSLRGSSTLRFYRNLNLEACLWEFTSYYDMSELLSDCGGTIGTDGQVSISTFELLGQFKKAGDPLEDRNVCSVVTGLFCLIISRPFFFFQNKTPGFSILINHLQPVWFSLKDGKVNK